MFAVQERIDAPSELVWQHLTDPQKVTDWMKSVEGLAVDDGGSIRPGADLKFKARGREHKSEVVEFEEGRHLALRSTQGPITATYRYSLSPEGPATVARLEAD